MDILYELTIVGVHGNLRRIIDIVDNQITVGTCNHTDVIAYTGSTRLQVT